ncbi:MAG: DNA damage-inducible protein D [Methanomassiliicoccaceae archaeon]|jgi:DNA-damage-inducible protein D|nr:DNA damage-inducible protein D [Methanomassiliicoccaceae archaeon]
MKEVKAPEYVMFEEIKHIRTDGSEYWSARELASVLNYTEWRNFVKVIEKAMIACDNSGHNIVHDFVDVNKMVDAGVASKSIKDYELSRYACYLIVQNGDPRKEVIALGQTYFAIQTHRQEIRDKFNQLDEDRRRLVVRGEVKHYNQMLTEAARDAGVITAKEFAYFQNKGYMGLYGGLTVENIRDKKGLRIRDKILDFMGSAERGANLFRIIYTEDILKRDSIDNAEDANEVHNLVGREVREAIKRIRGTMPEDMPTPKKSISQIEKEQLAELKRKADEGSLILDE